MTMDKATLIERNKKRLAANIAESERQAQYIGERLGVFARLCELEATRKRIVRRLMEIDPENEVEYAQHLF